MEINKIRKIGGKIARIRFAIGAIIVGLFFAAIGGFITYKSVTHPTTYEPVEATISEVNGVSTIDDSSYDVMLTYSVDGTSYTNPFTASTDKLGAKITIYYDIENPNNISSSGSSSFVVPAVIAGVGVVTIVIGVFTLVKDKKKGNVDELDQVDMSKISEEQIDEIKNSDEPSKEYYFHFCGKLNQSYVLETPERMAIITMDCNKVGVVSKSKFTFTNKITCTSTEYEVSHTVTTSYGGNHFSINSNSSFKMNGVDVFDLIASKGYSIITKIEGIRLNFDVLHYGVPVATLRAAGVNVIKGGPTKLGNIPANGIFVVNARVSDLDAVALIAFAVSRVEFF